MNFIQSFSLSDKSNSMQIPSTASVPPTTVTPQFTGIAVPSPQPQTTIPTQSIIIEGAFLNIDPPTISLSHSNDLVKIYGNIGREPDKGERVIINLNLPDNTVHSPERLQISKDGNFETYYSN